MAEKAVRKRVRLTTGVAVALAFIMVASATVLVGSSSVAHSTAPKGESAPSLVGITESSRTSGHVPGASPVTETTARPLPSHPAPPVGLVGTVGTGLTATGPYFPVYDPGNGFVYVSDFTNHTVTVIDGLSVEATIGVGASPGLGAYDAQNGYVYIPNIGSASVSVIDGTTLLTTVGVGNSPILAIYDSSNGYVYVTNDGSKNVSVLDGTSVVATVTVGLEPLYGTYDSNDGTVYVMNFGSDNVSIIHGTTVVGSVNVGSGAYFPTYDPVNNTVYVPNALSQNVSVLRGTSLLGTVAVGEAPQGATYASNGYVYVSNDDSDTVSVIQGLSVVATVPVGHGPDYSAYDSAFGYLYVVNVDSNNVTVLNGTHVIANITVGAGPEYVAVDPVTHYVYVPNVATNTVSVLGPTQPSYPVTFTESGLAPGTNWQASLNGVVSSSLTPTITYAVQNGSYSFSIPAVAGSTPTPASGSVVVNGAPVSRAIVFTAPGSYNLTFTETGLLAGTQWAVVLNGSTVTSQTSSIAFVEPNGTYAYSVSAAGYNASPSSGSVVVAGAGIEVPVAFTPIVVPTGVTVTESGLTIGQHWAATIGGKLETALAGHWLNFSLPAGTYSYTVSAITTGWVATPGSGNVVVSTGFTSLAVAFSPAVLTYTIYFTASGIYPGTSWSVTIGSTTLTSTGASLSFPDMTAGPHSYAVTPPSGYTATPSSGSITISAVSVSVGIVFAPVTYTVTFTESGLVTGSLWAVSLGGVLYWSTSSSITFQVVGGASYTWLVGHITGETPNQSSGSTGVVSGPLVYTIVFT